MVDEWMEWMSGWNNGIMEYWSYGCCVKGEMG
jgi:hypothetical protein